MSQPLRLSDSQMDAVMRAAQPLAPNVRVAFLEALAQVLAAQPVIGDGSVGRAIAATQRAFFDAPELGHCASHGKYD
jgi:hypothetical protein